MDFQQYYFTEKFGMETDYIVPEDKEEQLYDFYALSLINYDKLDDFEEKMFFTEARDKLIKTLGTSMINAVIYAVVAEMWHFIDKCLVNEPNYDREHHDNPDYITKLLNNDYQKTHNINQQDVNILISMDEFVPKRSSDIVMMLPDRDDRYDIMVNRFALSPYKIASLAEKIFNQTYFKWRSNYGGNAWMKVASGLKRLIDAMKGNNIGDKMVAIDHLYDLQHNNGTVFDKVQEFKKDAGYYWLANALNHKAKIKDPIVFYNHVSSSLKRPLAKKFKELFGKSVEQVSGSLIDYQNEFDALKPIIRGKIDKFFKEYYFNDPVEDLPNSGLMYDDLWEFIKSDINQMIESNYKAIQLLLSNENISRSAIERMIDQNLHEIHFEIERLKGNLINDNSMKAIQQRKELYTNQFYYRVWASVRDYVDEQF